MKQWASRLTLAVVAATACGGYGATRMEDTTPQPIEETPPMAPSAAEFVSEAEDVLLKRGVQNARASWVMSNFITEDTEALAARANEEYVAAAVAYGVEAASFDTSALDEALARKLRLMQTGFSMPAPSDPELTAEMQDHVIDAIRAFDG